MDTSQKIIMGVALATLVIAIIVFFSSGKDEKLNQVVHQQMPTQPMQPMRYQEEPQMQYPENTDVQQGEWNPEQNNNNNGVLVMFFAPWCGHCKSLKPVWEELTKNFDGYNNVRILQVDGQENGQLAEMHGVRGFPTIKFCPNGVENPDSIEYQGDRSIASLAQFLQENA